MSNHTTTEEPTMSTATYVCGYCHAVTITADDIPLCDRCDGYLYEEPLEVGAAVTLHHAKSDRRKRGTITKIGRTRLSIEVALADGRLVTTTRSATDTDLRFP